MYKYIVFDLDNTLLDYQKSEKDSLQSALRKHAVDERSDFEWNRFWDAFSSRSAYYWQRRETLSLDGKMVMHRALTDAFTSSSCRIEANQIDKLTHTYWRTFCTARHIEEGAPELLRWAFDHFTLGIVSNGMGEAQRSRLQAADWEQYFQSLVFSDEVGKHKPDPYIFEVSLRQLGARKDEVLYIGDSWHDDFAGALNVGIDFCHYTRRVNASELPVSGPKPHYSVSRLGELMQLLHRFLEEEQAL